MNGVELNASSTRGLFGSGIEDGERDRKLVHCSLKSFR